MEYYINWNTGVDWEYAGDNLDKAMERADKEVDYTQSNIQILAIVDGEVEEVAVRIWYGVEASEEDEQEDIISFGSFGFYDEWIELNSPTNGWNFN